MFFWQQFLQLLFDSIEHDSDTIISLLGMRDQTGRSVILEETEITFIRQWSSDTTNE